MTVAMNQLARRQTVESKYSHFGGSEAELLRLVEENLENATPGYRDGVILVSVPSEGFFSGVVEVTEEMRLIATFASRRRGEEPYIAVEAIGAPKLPARHVELVLYLHDVLGEDASSEAEWELVSINARPTEGEEPLKPMAMARNFLELPGGTKAEYTAEEFARSIQYWSTRAMCGSE
jgi:hypothetical protein